MRRREIREIRLNGELKNERIKKRKRKKETARRGIRGIRLEGELKMRG